MNILKDYYKILGASIDSSDKEIKKLYYKLSFIHHPDKGGDEIIFNELTEAYDTILGDEREEYDKKSRWGKDYDEIQELFNIDFNYDWNKSNSDYEKFKNDILDIMIQVDGKFNGSLNFPRWIVCKDCRGSGKDLKSKIEIKDEFGKVIAMFDSEDGCDFCEGSGKDFMGGVCGFCSGGGKVGASICPKCTDGRILGSQKVSKIKLDGDRTIVKGMGHFSKTGEVGNLVILTKVD